MCPLNGFGVEKIVSIPAPAARSTRLPRAARPRLFRQAIPGPDEHAARADRARELDVQPAIPDDERACGIDAQLPRRPIDEAACRLPAVAADRVLFDLAVRMVRTIVIRVDAGAAGLEQAGDVLMDIVDDRFGEEPPRHARLVGRQHDAEAGAIERAHGVDRPRIELDALDAIEIADLFDER